MFFLFVFFVGKPSPQTRYRAPVGDLDNLLVCHSKGSPKQNPAPGKLRSLERLPSPGRRRLWADDFLADEFLAVASSQRKPRVKVHEVTSRVSAQSRCQNRVLER